MKGAKGDRETPTPGRRGESFEVLFWDGGGCGLNIKVTVRLPPHSLPPRGHPDNLLDLQFLRVACVTEKDGNGLFHISYTIKSLTKHCVYMQLLKIIVMTS